MEWNAEAAEGLQAAHNPQQTPIQSNPPKWDWIELLFCFVGEVKKYYNSKLII